MQLYRYIPVYIYTYIIYVCVTISEVSSFGKINKNYSQNKVAEWPPTPSMHLIAIHFTMNSNFCPQKISQFSPSWWFPQGFNPFEEY